MAEEQNLSPEEQREQVKQRVIEKAKQKFVKEDGSIDVDGLLNDYWLKDEKLHFKNRENAERRQTDEQRVKELEAKEAKLKEIQEKELREQKKFEELLSKKEQEMQSLSEKLKQLDELEKFKQGVLESQQKEIENKLSQLTDEQREIYETASNAMLPDAYSQRLNIINKLLVKKAQPKESPMGGVSQKVDALSMLDLKQKDPQAYKQKLREQIQNRK